MRMEQLAGEEEYAAGRELEENGSVKVAEQDGTRVRYTVAGQPPHAVVIERNLTVRCDCGTFAAEIRSAAGGRADDPDSAGDAGGSERPD